MTEIKVIVKASKSKISRSSHVLVRIAQALYSAKQSFFLWSGYLSLQMNPPHDYTETNHYCLSAPVFFSDLNEQEGKMGRLFMVLSQHYSHFKPDDVELHKRNALLQRMPDIFLCGRWNCSNSLHLRSGEKWFFKA